jgi:hypothetical protein
MVSHVDAAPFLSWLDSKAPEDGIGILSQSGPQIKHFLADASVLAVLTATEQVIALDAFGGQVAAVTRALPPLIHAMCIGIGKKFDLVAEHGVRDGHMVLYLRERN